MLKKIALLSFLVLLIGWTGFAIYSITDNTNELSYLSYFNAVEDESVIAIHHPTDFHWEDLSIDCNQKNIEVIASLLPRIKDLKSAFLSKKRGLIVLETHEKWTINRIKNTFENGIYSFELTSPNSFQFGKFIGKFKGNSVLLYAYDLNLLSRKNQKKWRIDLQSSYSLIFLNSSKKPITKDIYIKPNETISYTSKPFHSSKAKLIDDLELFGSFIPKETRYYEFYEDYYLKATDPVFNHSPIKSLIKTGVVIIKINQSPVFIFDLNKDIPVTAHLNDHFRLPENNLDRGRYQPFPICKTMDKFMAKENTSTNASQYIAYSANGFGFITADEAALDAILLELEMRKSVSINLNEHPLFKESLPKKVSQRLLSYSKSSSTSWIGDRLIETLIEHSNLEKANDQLNDTRNYFTMNPGSSVISFCALSGRGNVILETEKELIGYKNGSLKWRREIKQALSNHPVALSTVNVENEFIVLPFEDHLEIIDKMGREQYKINGSFDERIIACTINKQPAFGISNQNGVSFFASANGKQLKRFTVNEPVLHWAIFNDGNKITLGIHTQKSLIKIDYNSGKKQNIKINASEFVAFTNAGLLIRGTKGMQELIGNKIIDVQIPSYWTYVSEIIIDNEFGQLYHDGKTIAFVKKGKVIWKKSISFSEISEVIQLKQACSLFAIRDALENKIYIFDYAGQPIDDEERPAQRNMQLTPFGAHGCSITTYLNDFIIQYNF